MKSEMPKKKKRSKEWIPRVPILLPPNKVINATRKRNRKPYDRKLEKSISFWR